jgi:drug/metabolite transporter (DMT)-like permease
MEAQSISLAKGRLLVLSAAILWSLSGAFTKVLTQESSFHMGPSPVTGIQIAFYRAFFAGLSLVPVLRPQAIAFRPLMVVMVLCFASMNVLFVLAMAWGKAANAILLQYTAPMWMYLASIWLLREKPDHKSTVALVIGLFGIGVIICGGWKEAQVLVVTIALGSGVSYAGVVLCLRALRGVSAPWMTVLNHLSAALVLVPVLVVLRPGVPSFSQLAVLFLFGAVQMALPYWLMARGMRVVSPQEAGTITLLEPLLNPVWAYLVAPETEVPSVFTYFGGACILGALGWRYWPRRKGQNDEEDGRDG